MYILGEFLKAAIAATIWLMICLIFVSKGLIISDETLIITMAIIAAGALAGGYKP